MRHEFNAPGSDESLPPRALKAGPAVSLLICAVIGTSLACVDGDQVGMLAQEVTTYVTIDVDPGDYVGTWAIEGQPERSGRASVSLVLGATYRMRIGSQTSVSFLIDADEAVTTTSPALEVGVRSIKFRTIPVTIDPGDFVGSWSIERVFGRKGIATTPLVLGTGHRIWIAGAPAFFGVSESGLITTGEPIALEVGPQLVRFRTTTITVDPGEYLGAWSVHDTPVGPASSAVLVLGLTGYRLWVGGGTGALYFRLDNEGTVVPGNPASLEGGPGRIRLLTTAISVDPGPYMGGWSLNGIGGSTAAATVPVVPGTTYRLWVAGAATHFAVGTPCSIDPPPPQAIGVGYEISVTCGSLDADSDGVPDRVDNCRLQPNPDQIDQDLDGAGDICDSDRDGDSLANDIDNCADTANADQADTDRDGRGDVCDDDVDGDGVNDTRDNCLGLFNPDQANSDDDGRGDACDDDDDNDEIQDAVDNCPQVSNPDQGDFDRNGQGDPCDGDIDGDGIANGDDACALTPLDRISDSRGCSGAQLIALSCTRASFVQHGAYVSCVSHAATEAVRQGLLSEQERASHVRQAARDGR